MAGPESVSVQGQAGVHFTVVSWNVQRIGAAGPKADYLLAQEWDLAVLMEVTPKLWSQLRIASGVGSYALDLIEVKDMRYPHGIALLARNGWELRDPWLPPTPDLDAESRPRPERWMAAMAVHGAGALTLAGFHAPYAAGRDNAEKTRNRARKRRAYEAVTEWLSGQPTVVVGMDGNNWWDPVQLVSPVRDADSADFWAENQFHGPDPEHGCLDTYRTWWSQDQDRLEAVLTVRPEGPLAITHDTGRDDGTGVFRMDRIYCSRSLQVLGAGVDYEPALAAGSDHALVWAQLSGAPVATAPATTTVVKTAPMAERAGIDRSGIVDYLGQWYDAVAAGHGPFVATLEAPMGMGKTWIIQRFFERLATGRQPGVPYWPTSVTGSDGNLLTARKRIRPESFVAPGGATLPWLWWGIECQRSHVGSPMQSLVAAGPQLDAHAEAIQSQVGAKAQRKEDALQALDAMFDLLGVVNPGAAIDAAQTGWGLFRSRQKRRNRAKELQVDRVVDPAERSRLLAVQLATSLREVAAAVPVVLVVDDAQWADPALVSLLRHAAEIEHGRLLIVCGVWPEALVQTSGTETFASWLTAYEAAHADRLARFRLEPMPDAGLAAMVQSVAGRTPPSTVQAIVELASGNPLTLNLILDLDRVRRDIATDGSIDLDPAALTGLPRDAEALYQELWRQLPDDQRRVLAALALQGSRFIRDSIDTYAAAIGQFNDTVAAFAQLQRTHSWLRPAEPPFHAFAENARYRVALDNVQQLLDEREQQAAVAAGVIAAAEQLDRPETATLTDESRRSLLRHYLELSERQTESATRDTRRLVAAAIDLAELELDALEPMDAIDLARSALQLAPPEDHESRQRAERVLGAALVAAGRSDEAVSVLESAAAGSTPDAEVVLELEDAVEAAASGPTAEPLPTGEVVLESWTPWPTRSIGSIVDLPASEIGSLVSEVVAAEGPVLFRRVVWLLRSASGATRAGAAIRSALERGLTVALQEGTVVASPPDASGSSDRRTLRLPGQTITARELGDRDTWDVPPGEFELVARQLVARNSDLSRDALKREVGRMYGWQRFTRPLDELLEASLPSDLGAAEPTRTESVDDPVRAAAVTNGVADAYDSFMDAARRHGLDRRAWPSSTTLTPARSRRFTLIYVGVRAPNQLHLGYSIENLERFLGLSPAVVESHLGANWRDVDTSEAGTYLDALDRLLSQRQDP